MMLPNDKIVTWTRAILVRPYVKRKQAKLHAICFKHLQQKLLFKPWEIIPNFDIICLFIATLQANIIIIASKPFPDLCWARMGGLIAD